LRKKKSSRKEKRNIVAYAQIGQPVRLGAEMHVIDHVPTKLIQRWMLSLKGYT
jgi:hypothetical protein